MEDLLPQALMIGVNYNDFWDLSPKTLEPFIKAYSLKINEQDRMMWVQGMYIKLAIASTLGKEVKYPKQEFTKHNQSQLSMKEKFEMQMEKVNSRFRREN